MLLLAILTVERAQQDEYRQYEQQAAQIMARYGGRIERVLVVDRPNAPPDTISEVHTVSFPDEAAFAAYRADAELAALAPVRARCVLATEIWRADEGPRYG